MGPNAETALSPQPPSQAQADRLKTQGQGDGATCWSLGRGQGGRTVVRLLQLPPHLPCGGLENGLGAGPQLPPWRLLTAAADKERQGPKLSPAPGNSCPIFSQDLKFSSLLRGTEGIGVGMAPLKPQKWEPTGNFKLHLTAPATWEERNKTTPAVPMTQEPFQQIYEKKYFIQKHCLHKCVAFVQRTKASCFPSPPPWRDVSTWDSFWDSFHCQLPLAACGSFRGRSV